MNNHNLIIGCIDGYNWSDIKNWVLTVDTQINNCKKAMLIYNIDEYTQSMLRHYGFQLYQGSLHGQVVVQRFYDMWKILCMSEYNNIEWVLTTDVRDVVFQSCPFTWLNNYADEYDLVSSSENIIYDNENWSKENSILCFGKSISDMLRPNCIFNAGVIAGKQNFIKELFLINYLMSLGSKSHNPDQTTYNILLNTILKFCKVYKPTEKDYWAAQIGTTLDPTKNYSQFNIEPNPIIQNNSVINTTGKKYCIVHQYDRNPQLASIFNF